MKSILQVKDNAIVLKTKVEPPLKLLEVMYELFQNPGKSIDIEAQNGIAMVQKVVNVVETVDTFFTFATRRSVTLTSITTRFGLLAKPIITGVACELSLAEERI